LLKESNQAAEPDAFRGENEGKGNQPSGKKKGIGKKKTLWIEVKSQNSKDTLSKTKKKRFLNQCRPFCAYADAY